MKSKLMLLLSCLMLIAAPLFAASNNSATKALDGKTFTGTLTMKGDKPDTDSFVFKNGKFRSTACDQYGYGDASYSSSQLGKDIIFEAQTQSTNGATIVWKGTVQGDKVNGNAVMKTASGAENKFSFEGQLQSSANAVPTAPTAQPKSNKAVPAKKHS